jgi:MYXO-CTERM domain-containing protein
MACSPALKQDGLANGVCNFAKAGEDPRNSCDQETTESCGRDGECNGSGGCRLWSLGTACGSVVCEGNFSKGQICNGGGSCINQSTGIDCSPYLCAADIGCVTPCASDADCITGYYCASGSCELKGGLAAPCATDSECLSGFCNEAGFCCDSRCDGQCETCDKTGAEGRCQPVVGDPPASKPACPGGGSGADACSARFCDGKVGTSCQGYAAASVICAPAKCESGVASLAATCDGQGACVSPQTVECGAYVCDATVCKSSCAGDSDCAGGNKCTSGKCISGSSCQGETIAVDSTGATHDCTPYVCAGGQCKEACGSTDDCAAGNVCDPGSGRCTFAGDHATSDDESGCGCRVPAAPDAGRSGWPLLLGLAGLWLRRRRRGAPHRS